MEENIQTKKLNWLSLSFSLIGILAPVGYLMGAGFYQGILGVYDVKTTAFQLSVQEVYVHTYHACVYLFLAISGFLFSPLGKGLTYFILILVFIFALICKSKVFIKKWLPKWLVKLFQTNNLKKENKVESMAYVEWMVFYVILLLLFLPLLAHHEGQKYSKEIRDKYIEKGCVYEKDNLWSNCSSLKGKDSQILYKGILIAHTKEKVAFFNCNGTVITKIPNGGTINNELLGSTKGEGEKHVGYCNRIWKVLNENKS